MKSTSIIIILIALLAVVAGCGNDQYAIEKKYWWLQKTSEKIFKNPSASPETELQRAVTKLNNFANQFPKSVLALDAQLTVARLYMVKEQYAKARAQLRTVINKYKESAPVSSEALFLLGNSYELENKWPQALQEYKNIMQQYALTLRGLDIPIYIAQHYKVKYQPALMINAFQEAIAHYKALSAKYPNTPLAFNVDNLTAQCYLAIKEWQAAINTFEAIIEKYKGKINPDRMLVTMAIIYENQLKNKAKAIETLQRLIKDSPQSKLVKPSKDLIEKWNKK